MSRATVLAAFLLLACSCISAQDFDFTLGQIPDPFEVGDFFPVTVEGQGALATEREVCRPIRDYIRRGSARFNSELLTYTTSRIDFADADSQIMTSRMQTRLETLVQLYRDEYGRRQRFTVLRAYAEFPDPDIANPLSLHYEGRTVRVQVPADRVSTFLTLAVQAAVDWVYYESEDFVRLSVIPDNCEANVDLCFMLDQSGSVGEDNHRLAINFLISVLDFFNVGTDTTRVGLVAYSTNAHVEFVLDDFSNRQDTQRAIDEVDYRGGWTATALALNATREILEPANNLGARPSSEGIPKIAVLLTDGQSNQHPIDFAAPALKNAGVQVYSVGIGNINLDELIFIASSPAENHVFVLNSFSDAAGFVDALSVLTCETPAIVDPCDNTTTDVAEDNFRYFQVECEAFSDQVIIELTDQEGTNYLYCSTVESNAGPLTGDTIRNETDGLTVRTCIVSLSNPDINLIYIGVKGVEAINRFSLLIYDDIFMDSEVTVFALEGVPGLSVHEVAVNLAPAFAGSDFEYSISQGNTGDDFEIDPISGEITVQGSLSFDVQQSYSLLVTARRFDVCCRLASIRVNVLVQRNRIDFGDLPDQEVEETASVGEEVFVVPASGGVGGIEFSITAGNVGNAFTIDQSSGLIEVASALDFETLDGYTLTVQADSAGSTMVSGTAEVTINVLDVNENPFFVTLCATENGCVFSTLEDVAIGTEVGGAEANDPDLDTVANGMLSYSLSGESIPFEVDSSGRIRTVELLDRETSASFTFLLVARDGGSPALSVQTAVRVDITDVNDVTPFFITGPSLLSVEENSRDGLVITQYVAADNDTGSNAEIAYSLSSAQSPLPFEIGPLSGALTVSGPIDHETVTQYTVTVTASNPDGVSSSVPTDIIVIDLNDNTPVFMPASYSPMVVEHRPTGMIIETVMATDADSGSNGVVRFSITSGNSDGSFSIDEISGEIEIAADIDREMVSSFTLMVRARDLGIPARSSFATVEITVIDSNDNAPQFDPDTYAFGIREDIAPPFSIVTVFAFDLDEVGNPNSEIVYSIASGNTGNTFTISGTTGEIQLVQALDFETQARFDLTIEAADQGNPSLSDTATVIIDVLNVNEDPPDLSGDQVVSISESAPMGSEVARFTATDPDLGSVTFDILTGNEAGIFVLDGSVAGLAVINLELQLDFETTEQHVLEISATDEGGRSTINTLTVNVLDENEFVPEFRGSTSFEIREEMDVGAVVGTLQATDDDGRPPNNVITFSFLENQQLSQFFAVDPSTGVITTLQVLDREMLTQDFPPPSSSRTIEVSARDGGNPILSSTATVNITLVDINDNTPQFMPASYSPMIAEHSDIGEEVVTVSATDADVGSNADIIYSIFTGNFGSTFQIDPISGTISVAGDIDRETVTSFSLTVQARDLGVPDRSSFAVVSVTVTDINDNAPEYSPDTYSRTVREDITPPFDVLTVFAFDGDEPGNANSQIVHSIVSGNMGNAFIIDGDTGVIQLNQALDFETTPSYELTVQAADQGVPSLSDTATVSIQVFNVNEDPPVLSGDQEVDVSESAPNGSEVARFTALDPDQDSITFTITGGNEEGRFALAQPENGLAVITLQLSLDFETTEQYVLSISASDQGGRNTVDTLTVNVLDENEFTPVFQGSTNFELQEEMDAGDIGQLQATDGDGSSPNNDITFAFLENQLLSQFFAINPSTGVISSLQRLDRESLTQVFPAPGSSRTAEVSARDGGSPSLQSMTTITVTLVDVNDNEPTFIPASYSSTVVEHSDNGITIETVRATDPDLGTNGEVRYSIASSSIAGSAVAEIDEISGVITVAGDIDREAVPSFTLTVRAADLGTPQSLSSSAVVSVTVIDINDNPPVYNPDNYSETVNENVTLPFSVVTVVATDADEPGNPNSQIAHRITSGNTGDVFAINSDTGEIQIVRPLDFETQERFDLTITAEDQGDPSLSDTATVIVDVVNVNENPPDLSGDQVVSISELAPMGSEVARFTATDPDLGSVTFDILTGNEAGIFVLDGSVAGLAIINLELQLDFETTEQHVLEISATDEGGRSTTSTLTVNVLDENEFAPELGDGRSFQIAEEMDMGALVGTLQATDGDRSSPNNDITFAFLENQLLSQYFAINPTTGEITTLQRLDREMLTQVFPPPNSLRAAEVSARDGGSPSLQSTTTIMITLLDINDNAPEFDEPFYETTILEEQIPPVTIFEVSATDLDLGTNADIRFSITLRNAANPSSLFEIDEITGIIVATEPLDCEEQQVYHFVITATDLGTPESLSSDVNATLTLLDLNDNAPIFSMPVYERTLFENFDVGQVVVDADATDADKGSNAEIRYSLIGQGGPVPTVENQVFEQTFFRIDELTGEISHISFFNFEIDQQINLTVVATDRGVPTMSSSARVEINILNVDERNPEFPQNCHNSIPEDLAIDAIVTTCVAIDVDNLTTSDDQQAVFYSLVNDFGTFRIDNRTGDIRLVVELDFEEEDFYLLRVVATDLSGRQRQETVNIDILDVNDNDPVFSELQYQFSLSESDIRNYVSQIDVVSASDADSDLNGEITFSIDSIDDSIETEPVLTILATDGGVSPRSATATLTIAFESLCLLLEYSINSETGQVTVDALCQVEISPMEASVTFGESHEIFCAILRNGPPIYQWIQNGNAVTQPATLPQSEAMARFSITGAGFEDAGEYACKVTTAAGSLQTSSSLVIIHVPPTITVPPMDVAVREGLSAEFTCSARGIPSPEITWFHGDAQVGMGMSLIVDNVNTNDQGDYVCLASNSAGETRASATLTVFVPTDVVRVDIVLDNPSDDQTCHHFDNQQFQDILSDITGQNTMVTGVTSDSVCEVSACSPNPCQSGSECELDNSMDGGYECICTEGYTGTNCDVDVNECNDDPCVSGSVCRNVVGSFMCDCAPGRTGFRCQYGDPCSDPDRCPVDERCVESLLALEGFVCVMVDPAEVLVVTGLTFSNPGELDDLINRFAETRAQTTASGKRRKRQMELTEIDRLLLCEPRFIELEPDILGLVWQCPNMVDPPSNETLSDLCNFLLEMGVVETCQAPDGDVQMQPTNPPPPETSVVIEFIQTDPDTNTPLDAAETVDILEETDALDELAETTGLDVEGFEESVPVVCSQGCENGVCTARDVCTCDEGFTDPACATKEKDNTALIVAIVIAVVVIITIIIIIVIIVAVWKYRQSHRKKQDAKRRHATELSVIENPYNHPQLTAMGSTDQLVTADIYDALPPRVPAVPPKPVEKGPTRDTVYENV